MSGHGVWPVMFIAISVSFLIGMWAGLRFKGLWLRLVFLFICVVLGFFLDALLGGMWAGLHPADDEAIHAALKSQLPTLLGGLIGMSWYAIWRLPEKYAEITKRNRPSKPDDAATGSN